MKGTGVSGKCCRHTFGILSFAPLAVRSPPCKGISLTKCGASETNRGVGSSCRSTCEGLSPISRCCDAVREDLRSLLIPIHCATSEQMNMLWKSGWVGHASIPTSWTPGVSGPLPTDSQAARGDFNEAEQTGKVRERERNGTGRELSKMIDFPNLTFLQATCGDLRCKTCVKVDRRENKKPIRK